VADQFTRGMSLMRKHNPQTQEDGFELVRAVANEHVADLMAAYAVDKITG
jgi:hypothetical protein